MKRFGLALGTATTLTLLTADCVVAPEDYYGRDDHSGNANYDP